MGKPMQTFSVATNNLKTNFEPIVLSETATTRVVLKAEKFPESGLRLRLVHQKGSRLWEQATWKDETRFSKVALRQGEFVDFELNTEQTHKLLEALPSLAALAGITTEHGHSTLAVVNPDEALIFEGREKEALQKLADSTGNGFWDILEELSPGVIENVAILKRQEKRQQLLEVFRAQLNEMTWLEADWQKFFSENTWIFGHGLDYRILDPIAGQPHYGGVAVTGQGQQKGDYLLATRANTSFTVLVEIKRVSFIR